MQRDAAWAPPGVEDFEGIFRQRCDLPVVDKGSLRELNHTSPALIRGLIDHWPIFNWGLDGILQRIGNTPLPLQACETFHRFGIGGPRLQQVTLNEFFGNSSEALDGVIFESDFNNCLLELRDSYDVPELLSAVHENPIFSAARKWTGIGFHRHHENWLGQVLGRKAWFGR